MGAYDITHGKTFNSAFAKINCVPERPDLANFGNGEGLNIKGLNEINMPQSRGVMAYRKDTTVAETKEFDTQTLAMDIPNEAFDVRVATGHRGVCPALAERCGAA